MDIVSNFENFVNRHFPPSLRQIINFQLKAGVRLEFEVPGYGRFELLDYSKAIPVINQAASVDAWDRTPNPYSQMKDIESYLQDFYPVVQFTDILPFARNTWGDQTLFLFVESKNDNMILVDLDTHDKPVFFNSGAESLINIRQLSDKDGILYYDARQPFDEIIRQEEFAYSLPDCISSVDDYQELISRCMALIGPAAEYSFEPLESVDNEVHRFRISAGKVTAEYAIRSYDGLVVRQDFLAMLNDFLGKTAMSPRRRFYLLSADLSYFGIACTDEDTAAKLSKNGYLQNAEKGIGYSAAEKEQIRRAADLFSEIENVKLCLKVMNQKLSPDYRHQTVSVFYETRFSFDPEGIELVKKMTGIEDLEKEDNGYNLIFTVS